MCSTMLVTKPPICYAVKPDRNVVFVSSWIYLSYYVGVKNSEEECGCLGYILIGISMLLIIATLPVSLCISIKVVQEYERAVIFRLGRIMSGGAKGPGKSATASLILVSYPQGNISAKFS